MIGGVALRVTSPVLVGRVAEAAQLWAAFERAVAGSPATVVVVGEAGVGKTRLVSELLARARARGAGAGRRLPGRGRGVVAYALMVEVLRRLAERGAVLLVVEDLHWADRSTRNLLGFLVRNLRGGVALVLTYRSDELHRRHPLRGFLAELERSGRVERLELGRLGRCELGELLAGILGEPPAPALVDEILA